MSYLTNMMYLFCRKIVAPCVDLKMLLIPFTDLDTDPAELTPKFQAAKSAFNIMMKSWVGIMYLTSDELALPLLVKMLKDPRVSLLLIVTQYFVC